MKKLFFIVVLLCMVFGLIWLAHVDPGYAVISFNHWMISTSAFVAVVTLVIAFVVLYILIRLLKNIFAIPRKISRHKKLSDALHFQENISRGILMMSAGDFHQAEKYFSKLANKTNSCANYLLAAQAAQSQQAFDRRDLYLERAKLGDSQAEFAVSLLQAQFYLQANQLDDALLILKHLYKQDEKNPAILNALKTIYLKTHAQESLRLILPQLKKLKLISSEEMMGV